MRRPDDVAEMFFIISQIYSNNDSAGEVGTFFLILQPQKSEKNMFLKNEIKAIAFDADDTLWENQPFFDEVEDRFCLLLSEYGEGGYIREQLFRIEMRNMEELGYGGMAFTLSMIETALEVSENRVPAGKISEIYALGRSLLRIPAVPLEGVAETLEKLSRCGAFVLILVTKGSMLDQQRKLERSGLKRFFNHVEIVSDKDENTYLRILDSLGFKPSELLMVGNSFKSDIAPVLQIGGYGAYIPFRTTWQHEKAEEYVHPRLVRLERFSELGELV